MIVVTGLHAKMTCTEPDCNDCVPVKLVLLTSGTLGFQTDAQAWQIMANPKSPMSPFMCRCPKHVSKIEKPLIQGVRLEGH